MAQDKKTIQDDMNDFIKKQYDKDSDQDKNILGLHNSILNAQYKIEEGDKATLRALDIVKADVMGEISNQG